MISYAQNFEDVMLWRALKDVKEGFYIDVGANDPVEMSVTKWFYEQNWTGINIEPSKDYYEKISKDRTRDINLCLGAGNEKGKLTFYNFKNTGLSTTDETIAKRHTAAGFKVEKEEVEIETLCKICDEYANDKIIHFLKIDVEGTEKQVIGGMNFDKYRPWIVVVEATEPLSEVISIDWEEKLFDSGYGLVYFDGLNRFYICNEKYADFKDRFKCPPNVFDDYVLWEVIKRERNIAALTNTNNDYKNKLEEANHKLEEANHKLEEVNHKLEEVNHKLEDAERKIEDLKDRSRKLENHIRSMENSRSWKFTAPFRYMKSRFKK